MAYKKTNNSALISTVVVAVLAIVAAVFAFSRFAAETGGGSTETGGIFVTKFNPTETQQKEMSDAANILIQNNHTVLSLYYLDGLPHLPGPYGNIPEDGFYTVNSDKYKDISQLDDLLDRTFIAEKAEQIKTNPGGIGAVYADKDGALGINADFAPNKEYNVVWKNPSYTLVPRNSEKCDLDVVLHDKDGGEVEETVQMIKIDGVWLLTELIQ